MKFSVEKEEGKLYLKFDSLEAFERTIDTKNNPAPCQDLILTIYSDDMSPEDNYVIGTMLGNFQKGPVAGKIQFGSGWWFCDNRDGMQEQLKALSNLGCLGNFIGMLTDSRSFVSYTRHEYFRRILCNLLGQWVTDGEYPEDYESLKAIVEGICYNNAKNYFNF